MTALTRLFFLGLSLFTLLLSVASQSTSTGTSATSTSAPSTTLAPNATASSNGTTIVNGTTIASNATGNATQSSSSTSTTPAVLATTPAGLESITAVAPGVTQSGIVSGPDDSYIAAAGRAMLDQRTWVGVGAVAVGVLGGWTLV